MNTDDNAPATKRDLAELRSGFNSDLSALEERLETRIVDRITELMRDIETNMLPAFHGYAKGQTSRLHLLEVADSSFSQRLEALEERVLNLETRRGPGSR